MGYDDNSLGVKPINPLAMSPINGTEALLGSFNWVYGEYNALTHTEDRYVSFMLMVHIHLTNVIH